VEVRGTDRDAPIVVVGAHHDSARGSPGANDNATGVAILLQLARAFAGRERGPKTLRVTNRGGR
jgi:Zn-dependent M28 family amino/carboxypeptidase